MNRKLTDREVLRQAQKDRDALEHRVRCLGPRYAECEERLRAICAAQGLKGTRENFLSLAFEEMAKQNNYWRKAETCTRSSSETQSTRDNLLVL
jgi:hypothetical protein